ncbi:cytochrome P450 [Durotheca rogersii]|uniref:cytochrome P450 n=1 Tax=Durotheca rogersii TaxID=419775 RepID=UPI00221F974F|nr:cytochrome P450 [Durotheca rogersii]KAI5865507.1 cytochrome P450 [Durotheca rogersii]
MSTATLAGALSRPAVLAPALLVIGFLLYQLFLRPSRLPPGLPIVGARPGEWFPLARARWRNTLDMKTATEVAYARYRERPCVLPVAGAEDFVVLPARDLQWLVDQPDAALDPHALVQESLQLEHTVVDPRLTRAPVHVKLVATALTRETGNLVPALLDEIRAAVDAAWGPAGPDPAFREVCVYDTMRRVVGQATNRVFVGLPLCRDPALLDAGVAYAQDVPLASTLLRFLWRPLRPLVAPLVTLPNRIHTRRFYRLVRPEIERRLRDDAARRAGGPAAAAALGPEPNDFLQWSVRQARELGGPYLARAETLAGRLLLLNFASIHTSSFAITHALLDLASGAAADRAALRAEVAEVLAARGGAWDKRALAAMRRVDSAMRESQRLNSFVAVATSRVVVAAGGVAAPSGVRLPRGAVVCAPSYPVFHDPALYPEPDAFRPFRFAERREEPPAGGGGDEKPPPPPPPTTYVDRARQAFATTSPEYTAFGHGRHACPGRFFAASELKLLLAYLLTHYDIEPSQPERPPNFWFGMNRVPPMKATIRIRRRQEAAVPTATAAA